MATIGLNMMFVGGGVAGGRVYAEGLLRGLASVDDGHDYVIHRRRGVQLPDLPALRFRQAEAPVAIDSTVWRTVWEYAVLPGRARRAGYALWHGLGTLSPAAGNCPFVLTIHDLIFRHFPATVPLGHFLFMRTVLPRVARRAARIIVPSQATARDVTRMLGVPEDRIRLVPYGPGNDFHPVTDAAQLQKAQEHYGVRRPYVISVSRGYPHKNLAGLLRAFALVCRRQPDPPQLVLVGERYRAGHDLDRLTKELGLEGAVRFTGFVTNDDLQSLYSGAEVFAFPSLCEGFGLPVLEAMACGTPVVASDASAVPEAVGKAGVLANARDPEALAAALMRVLQDAELRATLRARGIERVRAFSWERCARETLAVYRELL